MDAPNAPNPANHDAKDQFMDADARSHKSSSRSCSSKSSSRSCSQSPSSRLGSSRFCKQQCTGWSKCSQWSLHNSQPQHNQFPAGPVVPAPQVFYQNWIGKNPEFSGKPEEDAESHLLSTRDWMEAHNFPD